MALSRRQVLQGLGAGIIGAAVAPSAAAANIAASAGARPSSEAGPGPGRAIRLHRNENPYGASPKVIAAMREAARTSASQHPAETALRLRHALARRHRVAPDHVFLSCGSTEIIRAAADAHVRSRGKLVAASPGFEWLEAYSHRSKSTIETVPLTRSYAHDLDAMRTRAGADAALVYICNPNNPTGTVTRPQDLDAFVRRLPETTRVLIDEAYHHYVSPSVDYASFLDRQPLDPRVIVTRSFSKIHGLAGMRIGYAVAVPETARLLGLHELELSLNVVSATAALVALDDEEHLRTSLARNTDDRQEFFNEANARMLRSIDSQTNFVMMNAGRPAAPVVEHFRKHEIELPPPFPGFEHYLRVSMGTPEDMRAFWRTWDLLPGGGHGMSR
jgi:histidinol-phosphate aminotransferase